jgi:Uncharacterized protein affecting Mg2+/Co2+ transport
MEVAETQGITVAVVTKYLPERSNPKEGAYLFAYRILIENGSPYTVQLLRRHWFITDAVAQIREVEGEGVVGIQPTLMPGESFQYDSYCDLGTEMGKMSGTYLMCRVDEGLFFDVTIPEFKMVADCLLN